MVQTPVVDEVLNEPVRGGPADLALLARPGVDILRSFLDGESPVPPVGRLTGRELVAADVGAVTYRMPKSPWLVSGKGRLHAGVLTFLADSSLTGAVMSALGPRTVCTTAELSMTFLGRPPLVGGALTAEARCIHVDASMGLAEVFVRDDDGRLAAHGTSRTVVHLPIGDDVPLVAGEPAPVQEYPTPDPHARPASDGPGAPGGPGSEATAGMSGREILEAVLEGRLPRPLVDRLFGVRLVAVEEGRVDFGVPAHGWFMQEFGTVYGGMIGFLAKSSSAAAVQTVAPPGSTYQALDLKVNFLRPVPVDGAELHATGRVLHRGRHLVIATSEITHQGRTVAIATGTTELGKAR